MLVTLPSFFSGSVTVSFSEIALKYLQDLNLNPIICESENEARELFFDEKKEWPCLFSPSNTTGEKDFEEFYTENEIIDFKNVTIFEGVGIKTSIAQITKKISNDDFILNYRYIDSKKIKTVSINDFAFGKTAPSDSSSDYKYNDTIQAVYKLSKSEIKIKEAEERTNDARRT